MLFKDIRKSEADFLLEQLFIKNKNLKYLRFDCFNTKGNCLLHLPFHNVEEIRIECTTEDCSENLIKALQKI